MNILSRRRFLRGTGVALSLPLLEAMLPVNGAAAAEATATAVLPKRAGFVFTPNGVIMPHWFPEKPGADYVLPKSLASLAKVKKDVLVISGLAHDNARAKGDGAGDHARSCATFLTGVHPRKTAGADISVGQSIDQLIADKVGQSTSLPSIELGIEGGRGAGSCDSGYSCAYSNSVSWKTANTPMGKEINPKLAFERLFGATGESARERSERDFYRQSILDFVARDAATLMRQVGKTDRRKLEEYFSSVREIEQRIVRSVDEQKKAAPKMEAPDGMPSDLTEHVHLMFDLMAVAYQTDATRVGTLMLANEGSNRVYEAAGVDGGHHELSHHRNEEDKVAKLQKIDQYLVEQFAYFVEKLRSIKEGEGTLLDQCMIVYGSAISDGNAHRHDDLPILVAGQGGGTIKTGRFWKIDKETPTTNLFLSIADRMGVEGVTTFGDSSGRLDGLG